MTFLNTIPLIGALVACLLGILILSSKQQNRAARITLSVIIFLNAHNLFESYLYYNDFQWPGLGLSYTHYHLVGTLFLLYTHLIFKWAIPRWPWIALGAYTLIRFVLLIQLEEDLLERPDDFPLQMVSLLFDYFLSILLNILLLSMALMRVLRIKLAVQLNPREQLNFNWLKSLLILSIVTYVVIWVGGVISLFDGDQWLFYEKVESMFTSIFPLFMAFAAIRFPVFAVHGDFKDLSEAEEKYTKSSLTSSQAEEIWAEMEAVMEEEHPYRNPEYRLNDLAERLNRSLHHVSQVINAKLGVSFSDFINQYRVKEAQQLLQSDRAKQLTILAIALEAGFNSKTAFYNAFKKATGQTPSQFMRSQT